MCGIFGAFALSSGGFSRSQANAMSESVVHRGPDADGYHFQDDVFLGNRRLAILDLSHASDQPLSSNDGRIVAVQNGEIYNYIELRDELRAMGAQFSSSGDTEVILRAYEHWGPDFVTRLNGMFAIAIYDASRDELFLYRDRLGVKPLYLSHPDGGSLWFGSEIKTILANGRDYSVNHDAIAQYFALNYIPQPHTAFADIVHLPPGHMLRATRSGEPQIIRYWDLGAVACEDDMSEAQATTGLLQNLDDATRIRMRSDAPYGAFLSGGLDSSSVVGFMSQYQKEAVRSFSIGFSDQRFDESEFASIASRRFGTRHQTRIMEPQATELWPKMIWHCDQPHGDVSFMPMLQVSALAAEDVKMVLTGDGGDELFAGYEKYLELFPDGRTDHLEEGWEDRFARQSGLLIGDQPEELLSGAVREAFFDNDPYRELRGAIEGAEGHDPINRVMLAETTTLLPGNNLVKPDRMAMAHSLEVRSPFLDYRMAEFAFTVPGAMKLRDGHTKWIYKQAVRPLLGEALTERAKRMFTVPVGEWFRQALAGYCREILLDGRLESRGIVAIRTVEKMLAEHISGTHNFTRQLRALISLEIWYRLFVDRDQDVRGEAVAPMKV